MLRSLTIFLVQFCIIFLCIATDIQAAYHETNGSSSDWATGTAWTPAGPPDSWESVDILHDITLTGDLETTKFAILTVKTGATLTVTGNLILSAGDAIIIEAGAVLNIQGAMSSLGAGTITNAGTFSLDGNVVLSVGANITNTGTTTIGGNMSLETSYTLDNSNGTLTIDGSLTTTDNSDDIINTNGTINVYGSVDLGVDVDIIGGTLPVELVYFIAEAAGSMVKLSWETASEENNDFFEVHRSGDGISFSAIHTVDGNGTTSTSSAYYAYDRPDYDGIWYYRLKQVDYDGTYEHSAIISLAYLENRFAMYPAVLHQHQALTVYAHNKSNLTVISANGTVAGRFPISQGVNNIHLHLPKGIYFASDVLNGCFMGRVVIR